MTAAGGGFYAHLDRDAIFERGDVYRVDVDEKRASRPLVRLAILGAGGVAQAKYLPAIARLRSSWEPVELVGASTLDERQADKLARAWGVRAYTDSAVLLRELSPDAVLVTSSDDAHRELTLAALEAGCHVLVEKPIARTLENAAEMCRAAEEAGRVLLTVCMKRYSPPYAEARRLLDAGEVPSAVVLDAKFVLGYDYVDLLESGTVHVFDLARFLIGDVRRVRAVTPRALRPSRRGQGAQSLLVTFEFQNGAVGTIFTSAAALSLHPWERLEIFGDGAWLAVEDAWSVELHPRDYEPTRRWTPVSANTLLSAEEWGATSGCSRTSSARYAARRLDRAPPGTGTTRSSSSLRRSVHRRPAKRWCSRCDRSSDPDPPLLPERVAADTIWLVLRRTKPDRRLSRSRRQAPPPPLHDDSSSPTVGLPPTSRHRARSPTVEGHDFPGSSRR